VRGLLASSAAWILLISAYGEIQNRQSNTSLVRCTTGHLDRGGLLKAGVSYYRTMDLANRIMDSRARLLFVGSDESFYCERDRLCNSIYDRQEIGEMAGAAKDPKELRELLRRRRITHMLLHVPRCEEYVRYGIFDWGERAVQNFLDMWHTYGRMLYVANGVFLFEFSPEPLPPAKRKTGRPSYFHPVEDAIEARGLVQKIDRLFQAGRNVESLEACQRLVELIPGASHAYSYRAYAHGKMRKYKEATRDYERAIRLGYATAVVHFNLGVLLENDRKYARALERYLEAVELEPGQMAAARDRAMEMALYLGRAPVALKLAEDKLAMTPGDQLLQQKGTRLRSIVASEKRE